MIRIRCRRAERLLAALLFAALAASAAHGRPAEPARDDAVLERRVSAIADRLRCLVCQNQTIADSHAELAMDLKQRIREMLRQGDDEARIVEFMVQRYGDYVLYQPPLKSSTAVLWFGPAAVLALGLAGVAWRLRRAAQPEIGALTDDERDAAARALGRSGGEARP